MALAPAQAQSTVEDRIDATFALFENSPVLTVLPWPDSGAKLEVSPGDRPVLPEAYVIDDVEPGAAGGDLNLARLPRSRPENPIITGSVATTGSVPPDAMPEVDFMGRFAGSFTGSGEVQRNANERPKRVQCTLTGLPSANGVTMTGKCGTLILFRRIRAEISYDPASGRYSGVYVGANIGAAKLSGRRRGDAVTLTITWPKPVNGDTQATMAIRNSGDGKLTITVTDELRPGGPRAEVTRLALSQTDG
jgi:hypothetical protein